ncbi:MAG: septum formation protein Maf [Bacteroidota bacterium]|jgi:septum formation protein
MNIRYNILLASNSPRRQELLSGLGISYTVKILADIDESYPETLDKQKVAEYIAEKKAEAYVSLLDENTLVITADTVVLAAGLIYGKPVDNTDAKQMLRALSGKSHHVITGVTLLAQHKKVTFSEVSEVCFAKLDDSEIEYYVNTYKPLDKAGAYGVQEWIGYAAVEHISGSYFNIMGLPVQRLYQELRKF